MAKDSMYRSTTAADPRLEDAAATTAISATAAVKTATAVVTHPLPARAKFATTTLSSETRQKSANRGACSMLNTQQQKARPVTRTRA